MAEDNPSDPSGQRQGARSIVKDLGDARPDLECLLWIKGGHELLEIG
jgi:hypothetical protein